MSATMWRRERRKAKETLDAIDELLCDKENSVKLTNAQINRPRPSSAFGRSLSRPQRHASTRRSSASPGPGTYAVSTADKWIKPRIGTPSFRSEATPKAINKASTPDPLSPTAITNALLRTKRSTARASIVFSSKTTLHYKTREQKQRIQRLRYQKQRSTVGLYTIKHDLMERRTRSAVIRPFPSIKTNKNQRKAALARQLQQLTTTQPSDEAPKPASPPPEKSSTPHQYKSTKQWQRAHALWWLRQQERATKVQQKQQKTPSNPTVRFCDMKKQRGRDHVVCRGKNRRLVIQFNAPVRQRTTSLATESSDQPQKPIGLVPFVKSLGREECLPIHQGVFLVGINEEEAKALKLHVDDQCIRPRAINCTIAPPSPVQTPQTDDRLPLSPKAEAIKPSVQGHRFVRFENQTSRPSFINKEKDNQQEQLVLRVDSALTERLKFPRSNQSVVDYKRMRGRFEQSTSNQPERPDLLPRHDLQLKAPVCLVNMARDTTAPRLRRDADDSDGLLCKLKANHDELDRALQLLSKHERRHRGVVAMSKGNARFPTSTVTDERPFLDRDRNRNVLSTKGCNDQLTMVAMTKDTSERFA